MQARDPTRPNDPTRVSNLLWGPHAHADVQNAGTALAAALARNRNRAPVARPLAQEAPVPQALADALERLGVAGGAGAGAGVGAAGGAGAGAGAGVGAAGGAGAGVIRGGRHRTNRRRMSRRRTNRRRMSRRR